MANDETREDLVIDIMRQMNVPRAQAEAIAAIELGEVDGDLVELPPDADPNAPD